MAIAIQITPTRMVLAGGFDSDNRYLRRVSNTANRVFYAVSGPSIGISTALIGSSATQVVVWRWSVGTASVEGRDLGGQAYSSSLPSPSGFNTSMDIGL